MADSNLKGRSAFVAGGSSGINLTIAKRFAGEGMKVAVFSRSEEKIAKAVEELKAINPDCAGYTGDVRDLEAVKSAMTAAADELGPFDVLLSGAAGNFLASALDMSSNAFRAVVDIDLIGTFHACKAAHEFMVKPGGSIINISAPQAFVAYPMQSHVNAAKAGIEMLTKTLAVEWGHDGLRVNTIIPGPISETEGMDRLAPSVEHREKLAKRLPLRRFGTKDEVADLAVFLASDQAAYITGASIAVDGGMSLMGPAMMMPPA
ncbi:MAG: SDR family oxidoreductase [Planctomycetaceae bacterium]|nr:SDR family oxidoreductase [Planctomycetaceae bacterium]